MAAAYELAASGGGPQKITLLEASGQLGGKIETERRDGFLMELGPDSFLSTKPWAVQLCQELGLDDELIGTNPDQRDVFILHRGRLVPLPDGLIMMVPTRLTSLATTPLLSLTGKARAFLEPFIPAENGSKSESIENFVSRRFGHELYAHIVEPMMSGIYAGDGSHLSIQATFPMLTDWEREFGSVSRGALRLRSARRTASDPSTGRRRSLFLAPRGGLQQMVESLAKTLDDLGVAILLNRPVQSIEPHSDGYSLRLDGGDLLSADALILATPANVTAELLEPLSPSLARTLSGIQYASTATVNLAFQDREIAAALNGYGYVIPETEDRPALACTWTSTKFPHRVPDGTALLRVFIGRAGQEELVSESDDTLTQVALDEVRTTLGISQFPDHVRVKRWPKAMPQYNVGHLELVDEIERELEATPQVKLAGAAYRGIGIPDCIHSGRTAARSLIGKHD